MITCPDGPTLAKIELPRRPWIIPNFLPGDGWTLTHGAPKAGKSTLLFQLADDLSRGRPFLGRKEWTPDKSYRVAYVQADATIGEWRAFIIGDEHNPGVAPDTLVATIGDLDYGCLFESDRKTARLIRECLKDYKTEYSFFDSAYTLKDSKDTFNEAEGVARLLKMLRYVTDGDPHTLVHHSRKYSAGSPRDTIEGAAGHHTLTAAASAVWSLTRDGQFEYLGRGIPKGELRLHRSPAGLWLPGGAPVEPGESGSVFFE